jgi:thioredoxin 1
MTAGRRIAIVGLVLTAVAVAFVVKEARHDGAGPEQGQAAEGATGALSKPETLPRLVDLGRGKCIPCKMMAPILEELKREYAGRFVVDVIDIGENQDAATKYSIRLIPTQIFIDASGNERFRHEGFMSKADILAKWEELGVDVKLKDS